MLYSVLEVAEQLGVSKVTIYNKIGELKKELRQYLKLKGNVQYIEQEGLELIRNAISVNRLSKEPVKRDSTPLQPNTVSLDNTILDQFKEVYENQLSALKEQIINYREQLESKDKQIDRLMKLNENSQVLIRESQEKVLQLESKKSISIWESLRRKFNA